MWGVSVCEEAGNVSGILIGGSELVKYQHRERECMQCVCVHCVCMCVNVRVCSNKKLNDKEYNKHEENVE